ncbi:Oxidoreductase (fragment) [Candidatus Desulfosporosinus infrequens]|uniref:Oxidoreductase n=1 Tax=Candidatus Desulfosporosinus infrequens TaxID=2043169 RepID=A0A2U3LBP3_9FIRM
MHRPPTYTATKAAIHSYTQSLRYQLKDTAVEVIELPPPYMQTNLLGEHSANDPHAMPLKDFIFEVMQILKEQPRIKEVLVNWVRELRFSAEEGNEKYETLFKKYNDQMAPAHVISPLLF